MKGGGSGEERLDTKGGGVEVEGTVDDGKRRPLAVLFLCMNDGMYLTAREFFKHKFLIPAKAP